MKLDPSEPDVWLVSLPGWSCDDVVRIPVDELPDEIRERAEENLRCYALVNIGAERVEELRFTGWEIH